MTVVVSVEDLLFRSRIEAAVRAAGGQAARWPAAGHDAPPAGWALAIVDVQQTAHDPLALIRRLRAAHPAGVVVCFGSHVDRAALEAAAAAGSTLVLPRSAFVQRLPELLRGPHAPTG